MALSSLKLTAALLLGLLASACATGDGATAFGAAPQTYEPLGPITCQDSGNRGPGFSQDCRNRNGSGK